MKPKFILLNLLLALGVAGVAWQARARWNEARAVRSANLNVPIRPVVPPPLVPAPRPEAPVATKYADVAEKDLFTPDRNPVVVVPPPVVEKPKPMPPLPIVFGVMGLPSGTRAIMAEKSGAASRTVREGDMIGAFKVIALDTKAVSFDWEGKRIDRKIEDLIDRSNAQSASNDQPAAPPPAQPVPAPPQVQKPVNNNPTRDDFGAESAGGYAIKPGDTSPAGSMVDGYKKTCVATPFGTICRWLKP